MGHTVSEEHINIATVDSYAAEAQDSGCEDASYLVVHHGTVRQMMFLFVFDCHSTCIGVTGCRALCVERGAVVKFVSYGTEEV